MGARSCCASWISPSECVCRPFAPFVGSHTAEAAPDSRLSVAVTVVRIFAYAHATWFESSYFCKFNWMTAFCNVRRSLCLRLVTKRRGRLCVADVSRLCANTHAHWRWDCTAYLHACVHQSSCLHCCLFVCFFWATLYILVRVMIVAQCIVLCPSLPNRYLTSIHAGACCIGGRLFHDIWSKWGLYPRLAISVVVHKFTCCCADIAPFQELTPHAHYRLRSSLIGFWFEPTRQIASNNHLQVGKKSHRLAKVELMESQILQKSQPDLSRMQKRLLDKWYPFHPLTCTHGTRLSKA